MKEKDLKEYVSPLMTVTQVVLEEGVCVGNPSKDVQTDKTGGITLGGQGDNGGYEGSFD